jgi:hypothetical protein
MDSDGAWGRELIAICFEPCGYSRGEQAHFAQAIEQELVTR